MARLCSPTHLYGDHNWWLLMLSWQVIRVKMSGQRVGNGDHFESRRVTCGVFNVCTGTGPFSHRQEFYLFQKFGKCNRISQQPIVGQDLNWLPNSTCHKCECNNAYDNALLSSLSLSRLITVKCTQYPYLFLPQCFVLPKLFTQTMHNNSDSLSY